MEGGGVLLGPLLLLTGWAQTRQTMGIKAWCLCENGRLIFSFHR